MFQISPTLLHPIISRKSTFWTVKTGTVTVHRGGAFSAPPLERCEMTNIKKRDREVLRKSRAEAKRLRKLERRKQAEERKSHNESNDEGRKDDVAIIS
jgi:hypothetical protein